MNIETLRLPNKKKFACPPPQCERFKVMRKYFLTLFVLFSPALLHAQGAEFLANFPVQCSPGRDCWLIDFYDHGPGDAGGVQDFSCGKLATPQSRQTVIGTGKSFFDTDSPAVLAAAAGIVRYVKNDAEDDGSGTDPDGNSVQIEHQNGFVTIYTYIKKSSITVKPGETVTAGQRIGLTGRSGRAKEVSLGFRVYNNHQDAVDPFRGKCNAAGLWRASQAPYPDRFALLDIAPLEERPEGPIRGAETSFSIADGREIYLYIKTIAAVKGDHFSAALCAVGEDGRVTETCLPAQNWDAVENEGFHFLFVSWKLDVKGASVPGIWKLRFTRNSQELKSWNIALWDK